MTKRLRNLIAILSVSLLSGSQPFSSAQTPQDPRTSQPATPDRSPSLLSHPYLQPPIRGLHRRVRFSPDGQYLLLQSNSGFSVYSASSLKPLLYVDSENLYDVRFSRDSQMVIVISFALRIARWRLPEGRRSTTGELQTSGGCLAGELSPDGETFACYRDDFTFHLYDVFSGDEFLSDKPEQIFSGPVISPIAFISDNLSARPIGFMGAKTYEAYANHGLPFEVVAFSPDADSVLFTSGGRAYAWSISSRRKSTLSGSFKRQSGGGFGFLDADRAITYGASDSSEILSLKSGKSTGRLPFTAVSAVPASDSRYLIVLESREKQPRLFSLDSNRFLEVFDSVAMDVRENLLATVSPRGTLDLYHLGENAPFASASIPVELLPSQLFVAASPDLDLLSLGSDGEAGLFRTATGERILTVRNSTETASPESNSAYFLMSSNDQAPRDIVHRDAARSLTPQWRTGNQPFRMSSSAAFEYVFDTLANPPHVLLTGGVPFEFRARELASGRVLWKKNFGAAQAVPFPDPQGKRIVLAWEAKSSGAREAAKRCPQAWPVFRNTKLDPKDTFFEVLDGSTGSTLGGVLVRTGAGPINFDSVFSVGPALLVFRDEGRSTLYSLQDGEVKAHPSGFLPAASAESLLLAFVENGVRIVYCDLPTGRKIDQRQFSEPIAYLHFSADGQRLLVLSRTQRVSILDLKDVLKARSDMK